MGRADRPAGSDGATFNSSAIGASRRRRRAVARSPAPVTAATTAEDADPDLDRDSDAPAGRRWSATGTEDVVVGRHSLRAPGWRRRFLLGAPFLLFLGRR